MTQITYALDKHTIVLIEAEPIIKEKTKYQTIEIYQTKKHGKMLMSNAVTQLSEKDEAIYHEALVHPAMCNHANPKKALIIGGGDGGSLREALKHDIEKATIVDIDKEMIELMRKHFPIAEQAFKDKRTELIIADGREYVENHKEKYDVIIIDLVDPEGQAARLFTKEFYESVKKILNEDGIIAIQTECPSAQDVIGRVRAALPFKNKHSFTIFELSMYCEVSLTIASDKEINLDLAAELKKRNISLKAYTPEELECTVKNQIYVREALKKKWQPSTDKDPAMVEQERPVIDRIREAEKELSNI